MTNLKIFLPRSIDNKPGVHVFSFLHSIIITKLTGCPLCVLAGIVLGEAYTIKEVKTLKI
jgi:hypothetical protein